ncbi:hypothetical protein AXF42_Ash000470 [Apostasia shenzhenica]|uniref:Reverse transcriptase domain-containing protein n=1 Tax=Apostasia shenzhenica TaxID=1088818 RepID=A0A2I0AGJ4_9ASPA|nr:hypothetical protein AXF42_Ash000470 [Apostasia shenzhenica]
MDVEVAGNEGNHRTVFCSMLSRVGFWRYLTSKTRPFRFFLAARSFSLESFDNRTANLETLVLRQYRHGKFYDLLRSAIADPSFLLAACRNLSPDQLLPSPDCIARRISVEDLSLELRSGRLDVESCCIKLFPSRKKGVPLVLPNLKLKVVIEAIRMALEIVYEKRFATFAYGGRTGIGRHTAVRYLKAAVQNPTWWFRVILRRQLLHLPQLTAALMEKIDDDTLFVIIERLFASEAVVIELGGLELGRGFPQESNLNSILINIYFDGLDRELQEIRAQVHRKNPRLLGFETKEDSRVFHKPVRVYALRYLDELLIVTSGSKLLTMDIKDRILKRVEDVMELRVDKLMTSIHSAVSEKIEFMGMELQAVPPSVLNPQPSEKAMRARKKYLKQKVAKAQELKNARETRRKNLGMKILNHVFKKLKRGGQFKVEFHIESELREVFRTWAEEVVMGYFRSRDDCREWHRMLTSGDFLSLKRVRDQLPEPLLDAYDKFQEKVDNYFMPVRAVKLVEEENEHEEQRAEKRYAKRTVEDLTELCIRVNAPIELVRKAVKLAGFTNSMGRPRPIKLLLCLDDKDIIKWYAGVGKRWLDFFCCCHNFRMVKVVVSYHLRFSCILTLAEKHESRKIQVIRHFTKDLKVVDSDRSEKPLFPSEKEIKMMGDRNLSDPNPVDGVISMILARLAFSDHSFFCLAHFCDRIDEVVLYRVRLLQNRLNVDPLNKEKWVPGMGAIHEALNNKCLPLCSKHATDLFLGRISLQHIDCSSCPEVD